MILPTRRCPAGRKPSTTVQHYLVQLIASDVVAEEVLVCGQAAARAESKALIKRAIANPLMRANGARVVARRVAGAGA